jgi:glycosyltransferase involved in cell wall biosynthesis
MKRRSAASLLLLLLERFSGYAAGYPSPSIAIVHPVNHSVWRVDPRTGAVHDLVVEWTLQNFRVPEDGVVHVTGEKIGYYSDGFVHAVAAPYVELRRVELGSHFWTFALVHKNGSATDARTTLHVEIVLPQGTALPQWHYTPTGHERRPKILFNLPHRTRSAQSHKKLCLVGTSSGLFDGQKRMWLQTVAALPQHEWDIRLLAFEPIADPSTFVDQLRQLNVSIRGVPLVVHRDDLAAHGLTVSQAIPIAIQAFHKEFQADELSMQAFRGRVSRLQPPFAATLWQHTVAALRETCHGAVLVMANSRSVADQLLVTASRLAGVRAVVMELANLEPVHLDVDALVAPSHYALHHPSVAHVVVSRQRHVLSTGVDIAIFRPMTRIWDAESVPFVVGYLGRLSTDKSVGLVLGVARLLAWSCPHRCKVRIVGDGPLRGHLEFLAHEWEVVEIIHFTGGIYAEDALATELQQWDVAVSPGFHETLGMAPLEAMGCGVPVVAFATGGVLEYLEHSVNGLVARKPTAEALHDAIVILRDDVTLRKRLSEQARRTVVERFAHHVGVQQFARLYERLAQH